MKYVVYLTHYKGTKLPSWYIGSTSEEKVQNGYNGSIKSKKYKEIYDKEQKENKNLFKTRILSYHETREEALTEELRVQKLHKVVSSNNYFNEAYAQKNGFFGRSMNDEEKESMVKKRLESGDGDYHHGKNPFTNIEVIEQIKSSRIKNGNWHGFEITYDGISYKNIKEICKAIDYSEKKIRKIMKLNNIKYINDIIINNIKYLESIEPRDKKWLNRNIIEKDGIKYLLYYKLEIPEDFSLVEKYENPRKGSTITEEQKKKISNTLKGK